jgi:hypothetical protein
VKIMSGQSSTGSAEEAKQGAETLRARCNWAGVEAGVWTERMLSALENGVKGGKWYSFSALDKLIRRRLRAMLRRQTRRSGFGKARSDHQRWPNAYFANAGLFALSAAWQTARQSR